MMKEEEKHIEWVKNVRLLYKKRTLIGHHQVGAKQDKKSDQPSERMTAVCVCDFNLISAMTLSALRATHTRWRHLSRINKIREREKKVDRMWIFLAGKKLE